MQAGITPIFNVFGSLYHHLRGRLAGVQRTLLPDCYPVQAGAGVEGGPARCHWHKKASKQFKADSMRQRKVQKEVYGEQNYIKCSQLL